ncbi:MAG: DUF3990 domain-containing protein [Clostridium sp.]|nr:DUF3990 domain-containing protein [Clostridium sp.]
MIVYHGTTLEVTEPRIIRSEIGRDFGFAFYTTDIKEQAERWTVRKARIETRKTHRKCIAVVNRYEWTKENGMTVLEMDGASMEWLDMVVNCRSNLEYCHNYDIVCGKIANDSVGETISYVVQGIMRKEDALERLKFEKINNQIAFCTERSLYSLKFLNSYEVEV